MLDHFIASCFAASWLEATPCEIIVVVAVLVVGFWRFGQWIASDHDSDISYADDDGEGCEASEGEQNEYLGRRIPGVDNIK